MNRLQVRLAAALLVAAGPAVATADFQLYPLRGVFFPSGGGVRIHEDFRKALGPAELAYFEQIFRTAFPNSAKKLDESNRRRTFAVSLQVARASFYTIPKINKTVDVYLPITLSVYFTNVLTGEVLYAATRTDFVAATLSPDQARPGQPEIADLYRKEFRLGVDRIVADAKQRFQPKEIVAKVRGTWNGLAILDGGREEGIGRDDTLLDERGTELRVVSSGPHYAVAQAELGSFSEGKSFSRVSGRTVADVKKPRVLPLIDEAPSDLPAELLVQVFSDALGEAGPVSLVPVNRTFQQVLNAVSSQTDLSQETLRQRELPEHFVRLHVPEPIVYDAPTNLTYKTIRITQAIAFAEVVDRSGRVLFAALGRSRIEDEVTAGMTFDIASRREIAVKNALLDLAQRFGTGFRLTQARLPVTSGGNRIAVRDENGLLAPGANVRSYRNIGKVSGIDGEVVAPTWDLEIAATGDGTAEATPTLPVVKGAPAPGKDDVVIAEGVSGAQATRKRLGSCGAPENAGSVELPGFGPMALNLFVTHYHAPFYLSGMADRIGELIRGGAGFRSDLRLPEPTVDYCVQPAYRVVPAPPVCKDETCADVAALAVSYRVRQGGPQGEIKVKHGLEVRLTAATLPKATPAQAKALALRMDLLNQTLKLAPEVAGAFSQDKL